MIIQVKNLIFSFLLSSFLFSCSSSIASKSIEKQDHQKCVSQGFNYGDWDEIITEIYWNCRYNLAQARKINNPNTSEAIKNNEIVEKISKKILKNLNHAQHSSLKKNKDSIGLSDHGLCITKRYSLGIKKENNDYYRCRQSLVLSRIPAPQETKPPQATKLYESSILSKNMAYEYLKNPNNGNNIYQDDLEVARMMQKYPSCVRPKTSSDDFKRCSMAAKKSDQCLKNINYSKIQKELQDKIYCQQQAFIQFPDSTKDKSGNEIKAPEINAKKDQAYQSNQEISLYPKGDKSLVENISLDVSGDNEKEKLYDRVDLLKLRERFIYQCDKKMEEKLPDFVRQAKEDCLNIAKNWSDKDY